MREAETETIRNKKEKVAASMEELCCANRQLVIFFQNVSSTGWFINNRTPRCITLSADERLFTENDI